MSNPEVKLAGCSQSDILLSEGVPEQPPSYEEILDTTQRLVKERDAYKHQLAFAQRTIIELQNQIAYASQLASSIQVAPLSPIDNQTQVKRVPKPKAYSTWIQSWLAPSEPILAPAEDAWQGGSVQRALAKVELVMRHKDLTLSEEVNAELLFCALLRSSGKSQLALTYAEKALNLAKNANDYSLTGKAEYHRGLCYLKLDLFASSVWCFVLASQTTGHREQVEANHIYAMERCKQLPLNHPGREIDAQNI
ncbi:MAG: hypothetical protein Q9214_000241 [Letrouitia sp. 1 TL-2023]